MKDIHKDKIKSHQIIGSYSVSSIIGVMIAFFIFSADSFAQNSNIDSDIDYDDVYGSKKSRIALSNKREKQEALAQQRANEARTRAEAEYAQQADIRAKLNEQEAAANQFTPTYAPYQQQNCNDCGQFNQFNNPCGINPCGNVGFNNPCGFGNPCGNRGFGFNNNFNRGWGNGWNSGWSMGWSSRFGWNSGFSMGYGNGWNNPWNNPWNRWNDPFMNGGWGNGFYGYGNAWNNGWGNNWNNGWNNNGWNNYDRVYRGDRRSQNVTAARQNRGGNVVIPTNTGSNNNNRVEGNNSNRNTRSSRYGGQTQNNGNNNSNTRTNTNRGSRTNASGSSNTRSNRGGTSTQSSGSNSRSSGGSSGGGGSRSNRGGRGGGE